MSNKKNKEQKVEQTELSEPSPEALLSAIRQHQLNISGHAAANNEMEQFTSKVLSAVSNLATMVNNNNMMNNRKTAELQVKVDAIGDRANEIFELIRNLPSGSGHTLTPAPQPKSQQVLFEPIKTLDGLESIDLKSRDHNFVQSIIEIFTRMHGKGRFPGRGMDVCHQIFDSFFDRTFMKSCSWTGAGKNAKKIPFNRYTNIIDLYFQVVLNADPQFSKDEVEHFLHQCLKNSKQRAATLGEKKPVSRKRKLSAPDLPKEAEDEIGEEEVEEEGNKKVGVGGHENDLNRDDDGDDNGEDFTNTSMKIEVLDEEFLDLDSLEDFK